MTCTNPSRRHRGKRKLRPLVISLIPQNDDDIASDSKKQQEQRHEQITRMFEHPSLSAYFESPTFSPGVSSRELRNRLKLLKHCNNAGLIPQVEWEAICRAVSEQTSSENESSSDIGSKLSSLTIESTNEDDANNENGGQNKHIPIDPFKYLATTTRIEPTSHEYDAKKMKKKQWLQYKTTSLIPISPHRCGSFEDRSLPYSMELWRKSKTLNRDRGVLACTLAHLIAMKKLVGEHSDNGTLNGNDCNVDDVGFDFILEDNVRAFGGSFEKEDGCECANRIWDAIEASKSSSQQCHLRYYGWLGSLPNLTWMYDNHIPRSALNNEASKTDENGMSIFPFPESEDFALDSIDVNSKSKKLPDDEEEEEEEKQAKKSTKPSQMPQFTTPGGSTPIWGMFAYTISPAAYHSLISKLQNDVGSLMWKGKRMSAYRAKPIDKILPRHVKNTYGPKSVHVPNKVAFVRAPMLGSLLHPQWEEGFCASTERQYSLSCGDSGGDDEVSEAATTNSGKDGSRVWDHVWLTQEERQIVNYRQKVGKWVQRSELDKVSNDQSVTLVNGCISRGPCLASGMTMMSNLILATIAVLISFMSLYVEHRFLALPLLPRHASVDALFVFNTPAIQNRYARLSTILRATAQDNNGAVMDDRQREKLGKVPIISRKIPVEIRIMPGLSSEQDTKETKRLDVTVWEMDKPSDLIQEWWSIDESERSARVGDPFGVVMWPGSILASQEMMHQHYSSSLKPSPISNATVLVLGAGTGVEAQTAALLGAKKVIATDINPLTLKLLEYGANHDNRIGDDTVEATFFDLFSSDPLPACDIVIAADVLYNPDLAKQVGLRLHEAIVRSFDDEGVTTPTKVIITDSQKFHGTDFLEEVPELQELNALFKENDWDQLRWETHKLENVCASGVLVDEDQVYDVEVRKICWGWNW